jgi:hypothetical protein
MEKRPASSRPEGKPPRRPSAAGSDRPGTGEGARTALERLIEQERTRRRSALEPQPPLPEAPGEAED